MLGKPLGLKLDTVGLIPGLARRGSVTLGRTLDLSELQCLTLPDAIRAGLARWVTEAWQELSWILCAEG